MEVTMGRLLATLVTFGVCACRIDATDPVASQKVAPCQGKVTRTKYSFDGFAVDSYQQASDKKLCTVMSHEKTSNLEKLSKIAHAAPPGSIGTGTLPRCVGVVTVHTYCYMGNCVDAYRQVSNNKLCEVINFSPFSSLKKLQAVGYQFPPASAGTGTLPRCVGQVIKVVYCYQGVCVNAHRQISNNMVCEVINFMPPSGQEKSETIGQGELIGSVRDVMDAPAAIGTGTLPRCVGKYKTRTYCYLDRCVNAFTQVGNDKRCEVINFDETSDDIINDLEQTLKAFE